MNYQARSNLAAAIAAMLVAITAPASAQTNSAPLAAPLKLPRAAAAAGATATSAPSSRAQQMFGDISPKLADLTDKVLFGDVWERPGLSKRDRSLVTVSALVAMNRPDQLRSHLRLARQNGLTEAELVEAITHLAFYSGWPNGVSAILIAKEVFKEP